MVIETFYDKQMQPAAAAAATSEAAADGPGDDGMAQSLAVAGDDPDEAQGAVGGQPAILPSNEVLLINMLLYQNSRSLSTFACL